MKNAILLLLLMPLLLSAQVLTQLADVNGPIYATSKYGNTTIIGGKFSSVNGNPVNNIAWSVDQVNWFAIGNGINDTVKDIKYFNGDFFICGSFTQADTLTGNFIVRWNPVTHIFTPVKGNRNYLGSNISHLLVIDTVLFACGSDWAIPGPYGIGVGVETLYGYNPSNDTSFRNIFPLYRNKATFDITTDGSNLFVFYYDAILGGSYIGQWDGTTWSPSGIASYIPAYPYIPNAMQWYNNNIYIAGSTGLINVSIFFSAQSTIINVPITSLMSANGKLWFGDSSVYNTTGTGFQQIFATNGSVYSMMADSEYYFAGKFDSINGAVKKDFVKYEISPVFTTVNNLDKVESENIIVYPNPTTGLVYANTKFELIDMEGKKIGTFDKVANLGDLPSGLYIAAFGNRFYKLVKN